MLIYPLRDRVLVGTTDLAADPAEPAVCTEEEVDYFFALVRHVFPGIDVDRSSIVYRFSGIRPLPRHGDLAPGFVSRDYRVEIAERPGRAPVLTLVGGKWTTFRALGESLSDKVLARLGAPRVAGTLGRPIGGGRDFPADRETWMAQHLPGQTAERRAVLFERYGTRAAAVAAELESGPDEVLLGGALSRRELGVIARSERVVHLADLIFRRTDLAFAGRVDAEAVAVLAAALAPALGWDRARIGREVDDCLRALGGHGAELGPMAQASR